MTEAMLTPDGLIRWQKIKFNFRERAIHYTIHTAPIEWQPPSPSLCLFCVWKGNEEDRRPVISAI